jgi:hypothetical protein
VAVLHQVERHRAPHHSQADKSEFHIHSFQSNA